jgi:hypothetical protein
VSLASVRAQSADLKPFFEISTCLTVAVGLCHICMECMTKFCHSCMQCMTNELYDLYVLYDYLGSEKCSESYLNHYGSNEYV